MLIIPSAWLAILSVRLIILSGRFNISSVWLTISSVPLNYLERSDFIFSSTDIEWTLEINKDLDEPSIVNIPNPSLFYKLFSVSIWTFVIALSQILFFFSIGYVHMSILGFGMVSNRWTHEKNNKNWDGIDEGVWKGRLSWTSTKECQKPLSWGRWNTTLIVSWQLNYNCLHSLFDFPVVEYFAWYWKICTQFWYLLTI